MPAAELGSADSAGKPIFQIHHVTTSSDLQAVIALFVEYTTWIGIDLTFQGLAEELASMPGKYAPEAGGCLLLAQSTADGQPLGCVAMRAMQKPEADDTGVICEMKRLYVALAGRRLGLGRALADAIIDEATRKGYREMKLDTLPFMGAAVALYESMGFKRVDAYYDTPIQGTIFLSKDLISS